MSADELDLGNDLIPNPSWEDLKSAIECLDGDSRNFLRFGVLDSSDQDKDYYMIVQKSVDGRYMIVVQEGRKGYFSLVRSDGSGGEVIVRTDGIPNDFPENRFHDLEKILQAARTYYQTKSMDGRYHWTRGTTVC